MERRKKKEPKKSRKFENKQPWSIDAKRNLKFLGIDNCISLFLSPQTQRFIGCQIGEDITPERPWIHVKKEKIEDNLFLHENSSEFITLRNIIEQYPEDQLLIGSYRTNQEKTEEFMICTTIKAKLQILELLVKEKAALIERVKRLIYCKPNPWISLGSEIEVKGNLNLNNRNLLQVLFDSKMPILIGIQKVKFKYRFASTNPNFHTYDEILPDRRFYKKFIFRIRIDRASQITATKYNTECQTILTFPTNKYTQTNKVIYVLKLNELENVNLSNRLNNIIKCMEDSLLVNFHINLYNNDYDFPNSYKQSYARDSKELMNFYDVVNCKDLYYGSISWNALISGLIAVSYVERPRKLIVNQNYALIDRKTLPRPLHDDKIILLWCYSDNLAAKLYMHVNFEITSISFCPYDENILVGGGAGGQIVVWDLKNKLKQVESKEFLTTTELNHRNLVRDHTTWVKWPPGVRHVFPTIISDIRVSHKSPVISIQWLPSYHRMTKLGQIEFMKLSEERRKSYLKPTKSYQFFTCSTEDSCVLAWEIKQSAHLLKPEHKAKKKNRRLSRLPESLIEGISPLKKYNKNFQPFFKLKLELPGDRDKRIFVTDLLLKNPKIDYDTLNPETLSNFRERTFFREIVPPDPKPHKQSFAVISASGFMVKCDWTANNFDQGQAINEQICDTKEFLAIHDGPILSCRFNQYYPECILTVGGSVFGVWITTANKKPIFWRKGPCRYVSGLWSISYPLLCLILREDNYLEFWDLVDYTTQPIRRTKVKGSHIIDVLADSTKAHARKRTFLLTDLKGVIKVQDQPIFNTLKKSRQEIEAITARILKNVLIRKKHVENLNERLKRKYDLSRTFIFQEETRVPVEKSPNIAVKSEIFGPKKHQPQQVVRATKWQRKEEVRMYETLLQQKYIDIVELKQNTVPLMAKLNARLEQQKKIDLKLSLKDDIYDNQKKILLESPHKRRRKKISVSFPREMEDIIKQQYVDDYKLIEKETLENINRASRRFTISWGAVLGKRKVEAGKRTGSNRYSSSPSNSSDPVVLRPRKTMQRIVFESLKE